MQVQPAEKVAQNIPQSINHKLRCLFMPQQLENDMDYGNL